MTDKKRTWTKEEIREIAERESSKLSLIALVIAVFFIIAVALATDYRFKILESQTPNITAIAEEFGWKMVCAEYGLIGVPRLYIWSNKTIICVLDDETLEEIGCYESGEEIPDNLGKCAHWTWVPPKGWKAPICIGVICEQLESDFETSFYSKEAMEKPCEIYFGIGGNEIKGDCPSFEISFEDGDVHFDIYEEALETNKLEIKSIKCIDAEGNPINLTEWNHLPIECWFYADRKEEVEV